MYCLVCNKDLSECQCPDLAEKMRKLTDEGGPIAARWCARCDNHYSRCFCVDPIWKLRVDGKLRPLEGVVSAQAEDL